MISGAHKTWTATTPSVSLKKAFNDNMTGYVSANRGFKSGGFNGRANDQVEADNPEFAPEFVWTYEAGFKMQSADGRFSANIAAFHSEYEDFQARVSGSDSFSPAAARICSTTRSTPVTISVTGCST